MAYSEFTLRKIRQDLAVHIQEGGRFLREIPPIPPDELLRQELDEGVPLVLARGSEKARSEWIINPVLTAVRREIS